MKTEQLMSELNDIDNLSSAELTAAEVLPILPENKQIQKIKPAETFYIVEGVGCDSFVVKGRDNIVDTLMDLHGGDAVSFNTRANGVVIVEWVNDIDDEITFTAIPQDKIYVLWRMIYL